MRAVRALIAWFDDRLGISSSLSPIVRHPVPKSVSWWYVFGSATFVAFVVQVVTGVALAFTYVPAPNSAYESIEFITNQAILGSVVRGIHYFGASAMVVLVVVHMIRTFLMGSFKYPRELNWLSGVVLLVLTLGMAFTGQLLRWNQDAYWAVVVAAKQAGNTPFAGQLLGDVLIAGQTVGGATLTRFYATHVFLIPAAMFGLIAIHLFLVIRHGISEPPKSGAPVNPKTYKEEYDDLLKREGVPFWPDAAWRDVIFALAVGAIVVILAIVVGPAKLGPRADPTQLLVYPRPDWYFLWYFALLSMIPPALEGWVIIGFPLLVGVTLILVPILGWRGERSPRRRPWSVGVVAFALLAIAVLLREGYAAPWSPELPPPSLPSSVTQPLQGNAQQGASVFQNESCLACHNVRGVGGHKGPELTNVGSRLTNDQLTWRVLYGGGGMPAYGDTLQPSETQALVEFLATLKGGDDSN